MACIWRNCRTHRSSGAIVTKGNGRLEQRVSVQLSSLAATPRPNSKRYSAMTQPNPAAPDAVRTTPRAVKLSERDRETLLELDAACRNWMEVHGREYVQPMDCGGVKGGPHSDTLAKMF